MEYRQRGQPNDAFRDDGDPLGLDHPKIQKFSRFPEKARFPRSESKKWWAAPRPPRSFLGRRVERGPDERLYTEYPEQRGFALTVGGSGDVGKTAGVQAEQAEQAEQVLGAVFRDSDARHKDLEEVLAAPRQRQR